jgi:putative flippase GtrA
VASSARALLQYLITGGAAAAVDVAGFAALSAAGAPVALAAACSFAVATVVNFLLTSRWVFRATPTRHRYFAFLLGAVSALVVNVALTYVGTMYLVQPPVVAKTFAIAMTFLLNFWINSRVIFRGEWT